MNDLAKLIKLDPSKEENGVPIKFIGQITLQVASTTSKRYRDARRAAFEKHREGLRENNEAVRQQFNNELLAAVLVGWSDNLMDEGERVEYSPETALRLVTKYQVLRDFLEDQSTELAPYRPALDEAATKN